MNLLCLALALSPVLLAQAVQGTVANAGNQAPLPGVTVQLRQAGNIVQQTVTDSQGAFRFQTVNPGDYTAEFGKPGFQPPARSSPVRRPFHVAAGANPIRLDAFMVQLAKVSGRVTGGGTPIRGADVQLFLAGNLIGSMVATDEHGGFHFEDVAPGVYTLSARPPLGTPKQLMEDGRRMGWVRTWYPSATDRSGGAKITLSPGVEVTSADIPLGVALAYRVRGRVLTENGDPAPGAMVRVTAPDEIDAKLFELQTRTDENGAFEFSSLTDGDWRFTAEAGSGPAASHVKLTRTIAGRDLDRVELRFAALFSLAGRFERSATGTPAEKKSLGVMLAPREGGDHLAWAIAKVDGSFLIEKVVPGAYKFMPVSPGPPYYLASIEIAGRDVTGEYVELASGALPVTITYRADGGTVRGVVGDCGGATIVIAPQNPVLQYGEFIRQTTCRQGGAFEIVGVRPGDYYAFAFDRPPGMLEASSFVGQWMNQAVRITVRPGEATAASLKVTERGSY